MQMSHIHKQLLNEKYWDHLLNDLSFPTFFLVAFIFPYGLIQNRTVWVHNLVFHNYMFQYPELMLAIS